jgi:hypothetical protein
MACTGGNGIWEHEAAVDSIVASEWCHTAVAFIPNVNYTDWATATSWRNLVPTFAGREVSRGQRGESPTVVNLSFLDRSL